MISFLEQDDGPLSVFQMPEPGMIYTMGVDASTGLSDDYSVIQILSNTLPFIQCATFRAKWPVNKVSEMANMIGRWYNNALNVCEINYPGNSVQDALLQYYQYPRNYQREDTLEEDPGISHKYGFRTTENTKWMLIHELQSALSNKEIKINDKNTLYELLNYVYITGRNKAGAAAGFNDDAVIALMLALHGCRLYPIVKQVDVRKPRHLTDDPDTKRDWREFRRLLHERINPKETAEMIL